jgi:ketosteroid isomerase-like protein
MSQENVEVVRRMLESFHSGDLEGALAHFQPEVTIDATARPDGEVGHGHEALARIIGDWIGAFDDWHEDIETIRDFGDQVYVLATQRGRAKETGLEVEARYALVYRVEGGKITSLVLYADPAEALEAVGLRE